MSNKSFEIKVQDVKNKKNNNMDDQNLKNMINDQLQKLDENSKYKNE
jgi:hypothetical protein